MEGAIRQYEAQGLTDMSGCRNHSSVLGPTACGSAMVTSQLTKVYLMRTKLKKALIGIVLCFSVTCTFFLKNAWCDRGIQMCWKHLRLRKTPKFPCSKLWLLRCRGFIACCPVRAQGCKFSCNAGRRSVSWLAAARLISS